MRKTRSADVTVPVERKVLPNGLVVLLSPDPNVSTVVVDVTFRAGTLYEPPGRSGMAHLVEHIVMGGKTPRTQYLRMLESRGGHAVNAFTSYDLMTFQTTMPPEQLPFALWVAADRLVHLPSTLDQAEVDRNLRVVTEERALRLTDAPYGAVDAAMHQFLFPAPHPLHGMVIGDPKELAATTVEDVKAFIHKHLVPANGFVTVVGNFEPKTAMRLLEETLGRVPPGRRVELPRQVPRESMGYILDVREEKARTSRVTLAWRFGQLPDDVSDSLEFGAILLSISMNGSFGSEVSGDFHPHAGGAVFRLDVTLPHAKHKDLAQSDAEGFLRYLTHLRMSDELVQATLLAWDRGILSRLDSPRHRASLLTHLESISKNPENIGTYNERHWSLNLRDLQEVARAALGDSRIVLRSLPTRPRLPRLPRD